MTESKWWNCVFNLLNIYYKEICSKFSVLVRFKKPIDNTIFFFSSSSSLNCFAVKKQPHFMCVCDSILLSTHSLLNEKEAISLLICNLVFFSLLTLIFFRSFRLFVHLSAHSFIRLSSLFSLFLSLSFFSYSLVHFLSLIANTFSWISLFKTNRRSAFQYLMLCIQFFFNSHSLCHSLLHTTF